MSSSCRRFILRTLISCFILGLILGFFFLKKVNSANLPSSVHVFITLCGNNIKENGEECDGTDLDDQTCQSISRGFTSGNLTCTNCTFNTSNCSSGGGGGGGGTYVVPTAVILQGWAYPNSDVKIIKDGNVVTTVQADNLANFKATINDITAGVWTFGLFAIDSQGYYSNTISYTMNVQNNMTTTISNIFLPPTIGLDKSQVHQGDPIGVLGQTIPSSDVSLYISSDQPITKTIKSSLIGAYFYSLDTANLTLGSHSIKSQAQRGTQFLSDFSTSANFHIYSPGQILPPEETPNKENFSTDEPDTIEAGGCIKVNLNCDLTTLPRFGQTVLKNDIINLVDLSILLYNWGAPKNARVDLNNDGIVNYKDLSILLYYWTG